MEYRDVAITFDSGRENSGISTQHVCKTDACVESICGSVPFTDSYRLFTRIGNGRRNGWYPHLLKQHRETNVIAPRGNLSSLIGGHAYGKKEREREIHIRGWNDQQLTKARNQLAGSLYVRTDGRSGQSHKLGSPLKSAINAPVTSMRACRRASRPSSGVRRGEARRGAFSKEDASRASSFLFTTARRARRKTQGNDLRSLPQIARAMHNSVRDPRASFLAREIDSRASRVQRVLVSNPTYVEAYVSKLSGRFIHDSAPFGVSWK